MNNEKTESLGCPLPACNGKMRHVAMGMYSCSKGVECPFGEIELTLEQLQSLPRPSSAVLEVVAKMEKMLTNDEGWWVAHRKALKSWILCLKLSSRAPFEVWTSPLRPKEPLFASEEDYWEDYGPSDRKAGQPVRIPVIGTSADTTPSIRAGDIVERMRAEIKTCAIGLCPISSGDVEKWANEVASLTHEAQGEPSLDREYWVRRFRDYPSLGILLTELLVPGQVQEVWEGKYEHGVLPSIYFASKTALMEKMNHGMFDEAVRHVLHGAQPEGDGEKHDPVDVAYTEANEWGPSPTPSTSQETCDECASGMDGSCTREGQHHATRCWHAPTEKYRAFWTDKGTWSRPTEVDLRIIAKDACGRYESSDTFNSVGFSQAFSLYFGLTKKAFDGGWVWAILDGRPWVTALAGECYWKLVDVDTPQPSKETEGDDEGVCENCGPSPNCDSCEEEEGSTCNTCAKCDCCAYHKNGGKSGYICGCYPPTKENTFLRILICQLEEGSDCDSCDRRVEYEGLHEKLAEQRTVNKSLNRTIRHRGNVTAKPKTANVRIEELEKAVTDSVELGAKLLLERDSLQVRVGEMEHRNKVQEERIEEYHSNLLVLRTVQAEIELSKRVHGELLNKYRVKCAEVETLEETVQSVSDSQDEMIGQRDGYAHETVSLKLRLTEAREGRDYWIEVAKGLESKQDDTEVWVAVRHNEPADLMECRVYSSPPIGPVGAVFGPIGITCVRCPNTTQQDDTKKTCANGCDHHDCYKSRPDSTPDDVVAPEEPLSPNLEADEETTFEKPS